ncbi:hypothetical protein [Flavobacterium eburneipallidum]|uniref:hypothetical protein n=1 Tax=Flavobacterium eburneipallidum TaxID=3003263 RepID=UPI0024827526|nr:hypothetical protein [Flavobacterium eburneipallidum]
MIVILTSIIVILIIAILHLCYDFQHQKRIFENRIDVLEDIITALQEKQSVQRNQLTLSDTLSNQLKKNNEVLNKTILDASVDLFSVSFNKKE